MSDRKGKETRNQRKKRSRRTRREFDANYARNRRANHTVDNLADFFLTPVALHRVVKQIEHMMVDADESLGHEGRRLHFSRKLKETPYLLPEYANRAQIVQVRLFSSAQPITTVASTAYNTVIAINATLFPFFSSLATAFEEYRFIRGKAYYVPTYQMTTAQSGTGSGIGMACVDPADSSVFSSVSGPWNSDNKRVLSLPLGPSGTNENRGLGNATWNIPMDSMPDQLWIASTVTNQATAYWKPYVPSLQSPGSVTTGYVIVEMAFQFRGLG